MWKYQQKEQKKYKGCLSTWRITSKPEPVYAYKRHAYKKTCTSNSFVALPRPHATAAYCAHELINRESEIKEEAGKFSKINKQEVLNKVGVGGKKQNN